MGSKWGAWQIGGFVFTSVLGTLLHFLFDFTDGNWITGLFSAVNESIWEHMKLIYYPMILFAVIQWFFIGQQVPHYWCVKLIGLLLALTIIPTIYYTYTGALGGSADWFNITIFFLAAGAAYWVEYKMVRCRKIYPLANGWAIAIIASIGILFTIFTFYPPKVPLFQDPISGTYGICQST